MAGGVLDVDVFLVGGVTSTAGLKKGNDFSLHCSVWEIWFSLK